MNDQFAEEMAQRREFADGAGPQARQAFRDMIRKHRRHQPIYWWSLVAIAAGCVVWPRLWPLFVVASVTAMDNVMEFRSLRSEYFRRFNP